MKKSNNLSLNDLIEKGNILCESLGQGRIFRSVVNYQSIYNLEFQAFYKKWVEEVIKNISSNNTKSNSILFDFTYIDSLLTEGYFDKNESLKKAEGIRAYNSFLVFFKQQIDYLNRLNTTGKITLKINRKDKTIARDSRICAFRGGQSKNKRFEYIATLAKSKSEKIGAKKLNPNTTIQTLSGEVGKINERLKKDLDLRDDLIVNNNNSGYKINKDFYTIEFL
ncbi:MAG: hypothetical protein WCI41_01615 [bacterium]